MSLIRVSKPNIGKKEIEEVVDSLSSGWLTMGPKTAKFEENLGNYLGVKHVIATTSCTAALHLVMMALGIKKGDEVITPTLTYPSIGNILINMGGIPVFVDVDPNTLTIDLKDLAKKITSKTRAIVPSDYAGNPSDIAGIRKVIGDREIVIVEDAATSFGADIGKKKVGAIADFTCFSFYPTKNITTGEGGAVVTNNTEMAEKVRVFSKLGVNAMAWKRHTQRTSWFFEVTAPGLKYYMTDLNAAIGLHQLTQVDKFIKKRIEIAHTYYDELKKLKNVASPYSKFPQNHVWNFFPILIKKGVDRNKFMEEMENRGVSSSVYYIPMHVHPIFKKYVNKDTNLKVTDDVFDRVASLPLHPGLTATELKTVAKVLKEVDALY